MDFKIVSQFFGSFSNREIAAAIWLIPISTFVFSSPQVRKASLNLGKVFLKKQILIITSLMTANTVLSVYLLSYFDLWNLSLLKTTIFWFLFSGFYLIVYAATESEKQEKPFRKVIFENLKLVALLEFLVGFYTFSLTTELLVFPVMLLVGVMSAVAKTDKQFAIVARVMGWLLGLIGTALLIFAIRTAILSSFDIVGPAARREFFLSPLLTALFLPFLYLLALLTSYEKLFVRMNFAFKGNADLNRSLKREIIWRCRLSHKKVIGIATRLNEVWDARTREEADALFGDKL
jgi:hypothetical protein